MGLLSNILPRFRRRLVSAAPSQDPFTTAHRMRACRVEQLESRRLMAADVHVGVFYFEPNDGTDTTGNTFQLTWNGGAPGTQLTQVVIDTDKIGDGLTIGDTLFDTQPGGIGAFGAFPFTIVDSTGIGSVTANAVDGGTKLTLNFTGFDAGKKLTFKLDVDEQGFLGPNAVAEGNEFEGSKLQATFTAPHYETATASDIFHDAFDSNFAGLGLDLPPDSYVPPSATPDPVDTAGAAATLKQQALPITIAGTVFDDTNLDNAQATGEPGIGGVLLSLEALNGLTYVPTGQTTTTDIHGNYKFDGVLPGTYRVVETQPTGYLSIGATAGTVDGTTYGSVTTPDVISDITVLGGEDDVHNDFAEARPGSLSGNVYHDANLNGHLDSGEQGIGGATLQVQYLPSSGPPPAAISVVTAADGTWLVSGLTPGNYQVSEVQLAGWLDGQDMAGDLGGVAHNPGDMIDGIFVFSGASGENYDFGEIKPSSVQGLVFADRNDTGVFAPGDPTIPGVTVTLVDAQSAPVDSTVTDQNGQYSFTNLYPGTYSVQIVQPSGYFPGSAIPGSVGGTATSQTNISSIVLGSGTVATDYDFSELEPVSVSGMVYTDDNDNGFFDEGEAPIAGVTLKLLDSSSNPTGATTVTAVDGSYSFTGLKPGTYGVAEVQPAGFFDGLDTAGTAAGVAHNPGDSITGIFLLPAMQGENYDFGELRPASIEGQVHADRNGDCIPDPGEPLLAGVTIHLLDANGTVIATTVTDEQGKYEFNDIAPGTYGIEEVQPTGYFSDDAMPGSAGGVASGPDKIVQIVVGSGQDATDYNFCEQEPAELCGFVFADVNQNGLFDAGEAPVTGVTLHLLDAAGNPTGATVTTASDGSYCFTGLRPGTYGVKEDQPAGYFSGQVTAGTAGGTANQAIDTITSVTLGPAVDGDNYNFAELPPATVSGYVFQDGGPIVAPAGATVDVSQFRNGIRTPDDKPLAGVTLYLANLGGELLRGPDGMPISTVTDANGHYQFTGLAPGFYAVIESAPSGYIRGIDTPGTTGGLAVKAGGVQPEFLTVTLTDDAIVRILVDPGADSIENNFSVVLVQPPLVLLPQPPTQVPVFGLIPGPSPALPSSPLSPGPAPVAAAGLPLLAPPPIINQSIYYGAVGDVESYTWHLSVVDAGLPRGEQGQTDALVRKISTRFDTASWNGQSLGQSQWTVNTGAGSDTHRFTFGMRRGLPVAGDFNGDGITEAGVFLDGEWFIDLNGNGAWDEGDLWIKLGGPDDLPVTGDWNGDGKTDVGVFGPSWTGDPRAIAAEPGLPDSHNRNAGAPKNVPPQPHQATNGQRTLKRTSRGQLRSDVIDHVFRCGIAGDIPIVGDWNGDSIDTIGMFSSGKWYLDANGDGKWSSGEPQFDYGQPGDLPVVGDFDADGLPEIGVYRRGVWYIDTNHNHELEAHDRLFELGGENDLPVVGDFNGDGRDEPGIYHDGAEALNEQ